ncbi:hypothetical protein V2J09_008127 [Rumex salicifolius]
MDKYSSTIQNNNHIPSKSPLHEELQRLPRFSPECCIYRVPRHLQMVNEGAYTPLVISIGPLHHHDNHLRETEIHKLKYLQSFLNRSRNPNFSLDLEDFLEIVRKNEDRIRGYYADPMVAQLKSQELAKMVLVDSAFLIELFSRRNDTRLISEDDQMFNRPRMVVEVSHDIRLEENQIPFFILCELYSAAGFDQPPGSPKFIDIACIFLNISKKVDHESQYIYKHFLDLLRFDFLPSQPRSTQNETNFIQDSADQSGSGCFKWNTPRNENNYKKEPKNIVVCKTATALHEAGVKFKRKKDSSQCTPLDIEFDPNEGTLSIPRLVVQDDTEALFKNLAVFEQCHYFDDSYIIDYISFLDFLINTPEDVELFVKEGIIENWLGNEEKVADLFNGLNKHLKLRTESFYYAKQSKELDEYYNRTWNHHRAVLRQKYFNHPWATISVVYAVVLLLLTILQAITGVISALPSKN